MLILILIFLILPAEFDDQSRACEAVPVFYKFDDYGWDVRKFVLFSCCFLLLI